MHLIKTGITEKRKVENQESLEMDFEFEFNKYICVGYGLKQSSLNCYEG